MTVSFISPPNAPAFPRMAPPNVPGRPPAHSRPLSECLMETVTISSMPTPAPALMVSPSTTTSPSLPIFTTKPKNPSSAKIRLVPPPSTNTAMPNCCETATALSTSSLVLALKKYPAGPPILKLEYGASSTFFCTPSSSFSRAWKMASIMAAVH